MKILTLSIVAITCSVVGFLAGSMTANFYVAAHTWLSHFILARSDRLADAAFLTIIATPIYIALRVLARQWRQQWWNDDWESYDFKETE